MKKVLTLIVMVAMIAGLVLMPGIGVKEAIAQTNPVTITVLQHDGSSTPVDGASVRPAYWSDSLSKWVWMTAQTTDSNGQTMFNLADKKYKFETSKAPCQAAALNELTVSGGSATMTQYLTKFTSWVKQSDGRDTPVDGATVKLAIWSVSESKWSWRPYNGTTDASGRAWFGGYDHCWLADGLYKFETTKAPCAGSATDGFTVGDTGVATLTQHLTKFQVAVQKNGGYWLNDASVHIAYWSGSLSKWVWSITDGQTSGGGKYYFWAPDGKYQIKVGSGAIWFTSGPYDLPSTRSVLAVLGAAFSP